MKKKLLMGLSLVMVVSLLAGCSNNLAKTEDAVVEDAKVEMTEGALKTGLSVMTSVAESTNAGENDGLAQTDSTVVAVTVDKNGVIVECIIDGVQAKINFSKEGTLVTPIDTKFQTKNELGKDYGMAGASSIGKEWNEQVQALADYVVGKTVSEVSGIAVSEGKASDADLAAGITLYIGEYISAIEKAVANAQELGAQAGDKLSLAIVTNMSDSKDATADADGLAQSYSTFAVVTKDAAGAITSCLIDATQANVNFNKTGAITSDIAATAPTKNELGAGYGMAGASSIGKEWNEQAAAFASYVVGKTSAEVSGIAVAENVAADQDLAAVVTLKIGTFIEVVAKAAK